MASIASLRKTGAVRIDSFDERNDKLYYVIDVYIQIRDSHTPTGIRDSKPQQQSTAATAGHTSDRKLVFQDKRRYTEFSERRSICAAVFGNSITGSSTFQNRNQLKRSVNPSFTLYALTRILNAVPEYLRR